ncbi:hypothetical protein FRC09_014477 [Ceratobasidium sp. 395]|nr:hypothetical protein FRC09_014477 [Ceratobasidium sp. 395]
MASGSPDVTSVSTKNPFSLSDVIRILRDHGCKDITAQLDADSITDFPTHGGGFADIYQGQLKISKTRVAIKCARHRVEVAADYREMVLVARETHAWAKCNHENVLSLIGLAEYRGRLSTVSPWMENGTLPEYVAKNPSADRLELCRQVASGLAYLHECEMIHGDLKGANVLVSRTGVAKLADFGNMKAKEQSLRFTTRTSAVYSLRWAEIVTGQIPYADKTDMATVVDILIHKRLPDWDDALIGEKDKQSFRVMLNDCWSRVHSDRPRAAEIEFRGERINFKEFSELRISGKMKQIQLYIPSSENSGDEPNGDTILVKVETNDSRIGLWIRLQMGRSGSISRSIGELGDYVQIISSQEVSEVSRRRLIVGQLISADNLVDITHMKRLAHQWSQHQGAPRALNAFAMYDEQHAFCCVILECMQELFETTEVEYNSLLRVDRSWPHLEDFKAQFLSNLAAGANDTSQEADVV